MQKRNYYLKLMVFIGVFFFISSFAYSSVEVFSNYDTTLKINTDNTIDINKSLTLKNVYDVGIVPGQIEFKIARGLDGSVEDLKILNVSATDRFGKKIKTKVRNLDKYSVIILDIYYPLLPGFEYKFDLNYKLSYKPGGIFFKSLQIPIRESTIPIKEGNFKVVLPDNYHFTYTQSDSDNEHSVEKNIANWKIKDNQPNSIIFEYSYIPINIGNFKGSYIFWIVLNLILLLVLFFEVKKEISKVRREYEKK